MNFSYYLGFAHMAIEKLKSWEPTWPIFAVNELDLQCCFAGSSKTTSRISIFSIAMGVDYLFELNSMRPKLT